MNEKEESAAVRPDLAKFCHCDKIILTFGIFVPVYLVFGKSVNLF